MQGQSELFETAWSSRATVGNRESSMELATSLTFMGDTPVIIGKRLETCNE
jgi:hypothetical protein